LLLVPGAGHNDSLTAATWHEIFEWLDRIVPGRGAG